MILVTRLNGHPVALNCDLIERAEETPDTVLTLVDGTKYLLEDSVVTIIAKVREFRASVIAMAQQLELEPIQAPTLRALPDPERLD
jgi:flagellar protein FlbD